MTVRIERLLAVASRVFVLLLFAWILVRGGHYVAFSVVIVFLAWRTAGSRGFLSPPGALVRGAARARDVLLKPFTLTNILWIAVVLRLVWAMHYDVRLASDYLHFREMAVRFASGDASALLEAKSLITVLFYGAFFKLLGASNLTVFALNAGLGAAQAALAWALARRLTGSWQAARFAGLCIAVFPSLVMYSNLPSSDTLFVTLLLLIVWQLARFAPAMSGRSRGVVIGFALLVGAQAAALHLTRGNGIVLGAWVVAVALVWARAGTARTLWFAGCFAAALAVCVAPKVVYNYRTYGYVSLESSRWGALNLLAGTNVEAGGEWNDADVHYLQHQFGFEGKKWKRARRAAFDRARRRILEDPAAFLSFALTTKFDTMWTDDTFGAGTRIGGRIGALRVSWTALSRWFYAVMIAAACMGMFVDRSRRDYRMFLAMAGGVLLATFALHLVIEVQPRYHLALNVLLPLLAAPLVAPRGDPDGVPADQSLM